MTTLDEIVKLLDTTLHVAEVKDAPVALNGLQVENDGTVRKVALAVDGSQRTLDAAVAAGADLLILHHGLFWCGLRPLTGWWKRKVETCLNANLAVYSAHLPLDMHPELGNNARLAQSLGLQELQPELEFCLSGVFPGTVAELRARYAEVTGGEITGPMPTPDALAGRVLICSGGGGPEVYAVQKLGYRTFLTGEENHWVSYTAEDMGMNLFFAGHYATETFGVKALGELLSERFELPIVFIDNPTGM
ncbi:MAG: Nif3-like dinuclear metal center hexameric protein [Akkermansia sp.]|nr:Nif3-like dinuclear metal center hexameric protein [Akkermansia sp.]